MKKTISLFSLFAAGLLLQSACGNKPETPPSSGGPGGGGAAKKRSIAVIPKGTTHIYWQSVKAGAEAAGKEFNCQIFWNGPERETDRERQIQIIEDFIVQKVDGVVLAPLDKDALVPSVEELANKKIP